ncbi:MAG: hypothetical protein ACK4HW_03370 [Roseinatronobacter sp.]
MMDQSPKMTRIISAFSAWAERGLRKGRADATPKDDVQEYEGSIAPVIPNPKLPLTVHGERRPN